MCKESEGVNTDPNLHFVHIVCNTPEPISVLTFDWTLSDLERFCTNLRNHTVLNFDPTFNLGSFHVTITTYQHPMLEYRHQKRENHPVMSLYSSKKNICNLQLLFFSTDLSQTKPT